MKIVISNGLTNDVAQIKNNLDEYSKKIGELQNVIDAIPQYWQGADAASFIKKYKEALTKLKSYETSFEDYYSYLSKVYGIYNALNEAYDKEINTN